MPSINSMRKMLPSQLVFDSSVYPFMRELFQSMVERYRKMIDSTVSEVFETIMENDQQYPLVTNWPSRLESIVQTIEKCLANTIEIGLCYDLQSLTSSVVKQLEKFLMQICYHIGQFSNKKMHFGAPNPASLTQV